MVAAIAIIGAGHAGVQAIIQLRALGFSGTIDLFSEEQELPYQRPPLSKAFLAGAMDAKRLLFRHADFYRAQNIRLHVGEKVEALDRAQQRVKTTIADYAYDAAIIATGGVPRQLPQAGLRYLHRIEESRALGEMLRQRTRLVIIGGGYIGLEVAATARTMGAEVVLLEAAERILSRVAAPEISDFFTDYHRQQGVRVALGVQAQPCIGGDGKIEGVKTASDFFETDQVLIGIGMQPATALAQQAGLEVENGIRVNEKQQSSDPAIYAIGDCANAPHPLYGRRVRLESVQNAKHQALVAAAALCAAPAPRTEAPWFWSDQYDIKLQIAGLSQNYQQTIMRGDAKRKSFVLFYLNGNQLLAADCINRPQEFLMARKMIEAQRDVNPERLADEALSPKEIFS